MVSGRSIFLLDTMATYLVLEFWRLTSPVSLLLGERTSPDRTTQLHFQGCSSHSFFPEGANLSCPLIGKGSSSQSGSLYFLCTLIPLTSISPAALLLLLLATQSFGSSLSLLLPASQVDPQIENTQNTSAAEHHLPTIFQLQELTQAQDPLPF